MNKAFIFLILAISAIAWVSWHLPEPRPIGSLVALGAQTKKSDSITKDAALTKHAVKKLARITKYLATGNPMANGQFPRPGFVAVSDRSIKLGSLIWIGYTRYQVGDYTAKWVHRKSLAEGYDLTVDIFTESSLQEALEFGKQSAKVAILKRS